MGKKSKETDGQLTLHFEGGGQIDFSKKREAMREFQQYIDETKRDGTDENATREQTLKDIDRLAKIGDKMGVYIVNPPEPLMVAAQSYYDLNAETIVKTLAESGADDETIRAVLGDFALALHGTPIKATREQMERAIKSVNPVTAFTIDRNVLYFAVLNTYHVILRLLDEYAENVKNQPDAMARQQYFDQLLTDLPILRAAAFEWLRKNGYIVVADFAGVEQEHIATFLDRMDAAADVGVYFNYYCVAKFALGATDEQLKQIRTPQRFSTPEMAHKFAEITADEIAHTLKDAAARFATLMGSNTGDADTPLSFKTIQEQAREIITIPEHYALIMSRQLWAASAATKDGQRVNGILPITHVIADFLRRNPDQQSVTPLVIQKAIEGVNLLQQIKRVTPINGVYTFDSNLTEFSNICGYKDANETEKQQLLSGLLVIDGVFLVVWKKGGQYAQRILTVERFPLGGKETKLRLHVFASAFKGTPQFVSKQELAAMKHKEKGEAKRHFRGQILSKGHRQESQLIDEIFEFSDKIRMAEATGDAEQIQAARVYRQDEYSRARKKLHKWFDDWSKRGIIRAEYDENTAVWSWWRLIAPTKEELRELRPRLNEIPQDTEQTDKN